MSERATLSVVEITRTVAGAACGRLFAALGHEVTLHESPSGHRLRRRPLVFAALAAGKRSVISEPDVRDAALANADVLVVDLTPMEARVAGLDPETLTQRYPALVIVSLTAFDPTGELADLEGDSLLAEAAGGLAHMVGEPDSAPLALGGEQAAHAAAFVGLLGASLALLRRNADGIGDVIEVAAADVAAYMDWKSDVTFALGGNAPLRTGASLGGWRVVAAKDGWIGVIFMPHQWPDVVELIGDERLADPTLNDTVTRFRRAEEVWPVIAEAIRLREAHEVFVAAQRLGLPFGYAVSAADIFESQQLIGRGFLVPAGRRRRDAPVVSFPLPDCGEPAPGRAPLLGEHDALVAGGPSHRRPSVGTTPGAPLDGVIVLDFGTITAGAATGRILADYGATVIKVESAARPDRFRQWVMPGADSTPTSSVSPMFLSNNAGKTGISVDLKTEAGRAAVHELVRNADVLIENFRVGVTQRMGIDPATVSELNPELVYVSLSSQGSEGPEAGYASYGSTLDLLSGLASVTGYAGSQPLWSSGEVNYPDQVVALAGSAFAVHSVATGRSGDWLDISQRELVSWTLADQLAAAVFDGVPLEPVGNRRPHATPHDVYAAQDGEWIAIACTTDGHRSALAGLVPGLSNATVESWWWSHQDAVDELVTAWTSTRSRSEAASALRAAGVPAVAVNSAADRARQPHRSTRRLALRSAEGEWLKGFPMVMRRFAPPDPGPAPQLTPDLSGPADPHFLEVLDLVRQRRRPTGAATPLKDNE